MSNYNATILFCKATGGKTSFNYKFRILEPSQKPFFRFLFRVLQQDANHLSIWTQDDRISDGCEILINVYTPNELMLQRVPNNNNQSPFGQEILSGDKSTPTPIINLVLTDIIDDNQVKLHPLIPRYFQIIDSSIWNHYVPMVKFDESDKGFHALFSKAVDEIIENHRYGLYDVGVAKEFADVNARILQQSYLNGDHATGVAPFIFHSETTIKELIDKEFKELKAKIIKDGKKESDWPWRFRLLLIDDKAIEKEDGLMKKNCKLSIIMRLIKTTLGFPEENWIKYRLLEQDKEGKLKGSGECIDNNTKILIDCVQKYDDAVLALKDKKYDIILLDYLLDLKDVQRKYGYELLEEIKHSVIVKEQFERFTFSYRIDYLSSEEKAKALKWLISEDSDSDNTEYSELSVLIKKTIKVDDNENTKERITKDNIDHLLTDIQSEIKKTQFQIGPCGKLFFVFISAYSTAVNERLLAQGLNRSEKFWYINTGACPTNTPQLFTYNLLHSMNKRLNDSGILKLSGDRILELVAKIFRPNDKKDDKKDSVRKRASLYYHNVLTLQYLYRRMLDDVEIPPRCNFEPEQIFNIKKSVLISYYNEHQHLSGLLEHLTNLVHIAAFGTIRQWDEMWEEYLYFKAQFKVLISKEKEENQDDNIAGIFQKVCGYIESFILELKSQQR